VYKVHTERPVSQSRGHGVLKIVDPVTTIFTPVAKINPRM
jgi:hypothetical protein